MTKRMINFGSIDQLRSAVFNLNKAVKHKNPASLLPTIYVSFTEKIHGTNAAVCYSEPDGFWVQSKNNIIEPGDDNAGCAAAAYVNVEAWTGMIKYLAQVHDINLSESIISIYYEWAGGNIQAKSALTGLGKRSMIFAHYKVSPIEHDPEERSIWLPTTTNGIPVASGINAIYNVRDFATWGFGVDFENVKLSQNQFLKILEGVEKSSPVGRYFDKPENIGEGVVGTFMWEDILYRFKVKGDKHSNTKVKKLKPVDEAHEQRKVNFVNEYAITGSRLLQAWQETFGIEEEKREPHISATGDFLRWYVNDVMKEEDDKRLVMGLVWKELNPMISRSARQWFMEQLEKY